MFLGSFFLGLPHMACSEYSLFWGITDFRACVLKPTFWKLLFHGLTIHKGVRSINRLLIWNWFILSLYHTYRTSTIHRLPFHFKIYNAHFYQILPQTLRISLYLFLVVLGRLLQYGFYKRKIDDICWSKTRNKYFLLYFLNAICKVT